MERDTRETGKIEGEPQNCYRFLLRGNFNIATWEERIKAEVCSLLKLRREGWETGRLSTAYRTEDQRRKRHSREELQRSLEPLESSVESKHAYEETTQDGERINQKNRGDEPQSPHRARNSSFSCQPA